MLVTIGQFIIGDMIEPLDVDWKCMPQKILG